MSELSCVDRQSHKAPKPEHVAIGKIGILGQNALGATQARASAVAQVVARTGDWQESCEPPRAQSAASLIAVSKLFALKAGDARMTSGWPQSHGPREGRRPP